MTVRRCVTPGCDARRPRRRNWHRIPESLQDVIDPYHHRCRPCYIRLNVDGAVWRQVLTRKDWPCESCGRRLPRGSLVWTVKTAAADDRYTVRYPATWRFCDKDAAAIRQR